MTLLTHWLDELGAETQAAAAAEDSYRRDFARRVAELAEARATAFRRANLIRAVADAVSEAEDEQAAVAHGLAVFRSRLGWAQDSDARDEILSRFAPVCAAMHGALAGAPDGEARIETVAAQEIEAASLGIDDDATSPAAALAAFESWYLGAKGSSFWKLFENVIPETPLVDF